jgi:hypothetical protein
MLIRAHSAVCSVPDKTDRARAQMVNPLGCETAPDYRACGCPKRPPTEAALLQQLLSPYFFQLIETILCIDDKFVEEHLCLGVFDATENGPEAPKPVAQPRVFGL